MRPLSLFKLDSAVSRDACQFCLSHTWNASVHRFPRPFTSLIPQKLALTVQTINLYYACPTVFSHRSAVS